MVYDLKVRKNVFISPDEPDSPRYGIVHENGDSSALVTEDNLFIGKIDKEVVQGI